MSCHFCDGISCQIAVDEDASIYILHHAPRAKHGIHVVNYRYAIIVNTLIESDFAMFNRRILMTKDDMSNIFFKRLNN